jgi:hypothetical protein
MHIRGAAMLEQENRQAAENKYRPIGKEWGLVQPKELMGH